MIIHFNLQYTLSRIIENKLRFVKSYTNIKKIIEKATKDYCSDVINNKFPNIKNTY